MNELLAQAVSASDALAGETARAGEALADLLRGVSALTAAVDDGAREAEDRLEEMGVRLADAEQELARDGATAMARVQSVTSASRRVQVGAQALEARVREELAGLRAEKERAVLGLESDVEAARAALLRYAEGLRALEGEAALHLERQRAQLDAVRAEALALRQQATARAESLLDGLRSVEETARAELLAAGDSYADLGAAVQARSEGLQQVAQALTDGAASDVEQRMHGTLESAAAAAEPLAEALAAVERASAGTRAAHGRGFEEVGRRVIDATRLLQGVKADLEVVRNQLR
jgi:hypothetical protein